MAKFGGPPKFISMVRQFHDGMLARVQNDGESTYPFPVTNRVKQGCVVALTLFSKWENAPMVFRKSDTMTSSKALLKTSPYQQSRGNRLHRIEQSG